MKKQQVMKRVLGLVLTAAMVSALSFTGGNKVKASGNQKYEKLGVHQMASNGHYYKLFQESLNYNEAVKRCKELGGNLVTITSQEEQNFVYRLSKGKDCWLGASLKNGKYKWVTGEAFDSYSNWLAGQPSGSPESCLGFWYGQGGWNDYKKGHRINYICEWNKKSSLPNELELRGARKFKGHYYMFVNKTMGYAKAEKACKTMGGHLVTITSKNEQKFVYGLTEGKDCWLGGKLVGKKYVWITGERFTTYQHWMRQQPSGAPENRLGFWGGKGEWNDYQASASCCYVCEWEKGSDYHKMK